jgi:hypothetical protein
VWPSNQAVKIIRSIAEASEVTRLVKDLKAEASKSAAG